MVALPFRKSIRAGVPRKILGIDRANPLTRGLIIAMPLLDLDAAQNVARQGLDGDLLASSTGALPDWQATHYGNLAPHFPIGGTPEAVITVPHSPDNDAAVSLAITICCWCAKVDAPDLGGCLVDKGVGSSEQWGMDLAGTGNTKFRLFKRNSAGSADGVATSSTDITVAPQFVCGRIDLNAGLMDLYANGVQIATDPTPGTTFLASTDLMYIGARPGTSSGVVTLSSGALVWGVLVYNRAISVEEMLALYAPETRWSIYRVFEPRMDFFTPAAGGTGITSIPLVGHAGRLAGQGGLAA